MLGENGAIPATIGAVMTMLDGYVALATERTIERWVDALKFIITVNGLRYVVLYPEKM